MYKKISLEQNGHSPSSERMDKMFLKEFDQFSEKDSLTCEILAVNMSPCSIGSECVRGVSGVSQDTPIFQDLLYEIHQKNFQKFYVLR